MITYYEAILMIKKFVVPNWAGILLFFLIILLLYIPNFSKFGVMTPWEMNRAIVALDLAENPATPWMAAQHIEGEGDMAPMSLWMAAIGFRLFGISEAAARIPSLVLLMLSLILTFWAISRLISIRAAYFTVLVLAVFPLTGFMSFNFGGYGTAMCFLTMAFASIALARWWKVGPEGGGGRAGGELPVERLLALLIAVAALVCCYLSIGGIIGLLLPVATAAITQLITGDWQLLIPGRAKKFIREQGMASAAVSILFFAAFVILLVLIIPVAVSKEPEFNLLSGGTPRLGAIPTVDYFIEHIAYGTYPWGALLPAGIAALLIPGMMAGGGTQDKASPPRVFLAVANFLGFAAINFFAFRYVNLPYIVLMPAGAACGVLLYDLERSKTSWKAIGMIACMFMLLFFRDIHFYPDSMGDLWTTLTFKEAYPVKMLSRGPFALFTLVFIVMTFYIFLLGARDLKFLEWFGSEIGTIKLFRGAHGKKWKIAAYCLLGAWVLCIINAALIVLKVPIPPFKIYTSIARKVSYGLALVPVIVFVSDFMFRLAYNALASVRNFRVDLLTAAGFIFGFWFFNGYLPVVAQNLSPDAAVSFYKQHAKEGEELLTYRVRGEIGRFYGIENIREVSSQSALFKEMDKPKRVFALYGREDNPSLNLSYKEKKHDHIYVPEASTWRFLLASNKPLPGIKQSNPIEDIVRTVPPEPEYHVYANLENKVEYIGYSLETKHEADWAGALEKFVYTSYWHCTDKIPGSYKFFIHVDGFGLRLNGDHEPLEGLYPTRYWRAGDYLMDRFEMQVPIHFRAGDYTIYVGLFQGERRLKQVAGPTSGDNRIQGGILRVK